MDRLGMAVPGTQDQRRPGGRATRVLPPMWVEGSKLEHALLPRQHGPLSLRRTATKVALRRLIIPLLERHG